MDEILAMLLFERIEQIYEVVRLKIDPDVFASIKLGMKSSEKMALRESLHGGFVFHDSIGRTPGS